MNWISIEDKLPPEEFGEYLVWYQDRGINDWVKAQWNYNGEEHYWGTPFGSVPVNSIITHWAEIVPPGE